MFLPAVVNGSLPSQSDKLQQLVESFLAGRTEKTKEAYTQDLRDFRLFLGAETVGKSAQHLVSLPHGDANLLALNYKASLQDKGLAPSTINRKLASLRSLVAFANTIGLVSWKLNLKNVKSQPYRDTSGISVSAFRRVLQAAAGQRNKTKALRDVAILRLLMDLALRRNEIRLLDLADLDLEAGSIQILGKGRTEKEKLQLPEPTVTALEQWLAARGLASGALFCNLDRSGQGQTRISARGLTKLLASLGKMVGIQDLHPHSLRHTAITQAVKLGSANGIELSEVLQFSRHRNVQTLMIYRDNERCVQGQLSSLVAESI